MDLSKLDTEPLKTEHATNAYPAVDTWASPLMFEGVPAVLCAKDDQDESRIIVVPYPRWTPQGGYTEWPTPLKEVHVSGMQNQNWHGLEALSDELFLVADSRTTRKDKAYGGCLDLLDARDSDNKKNGDPDLESAHAVIWDATSQRIFALGATLLRVYSLDQSSPSAKLAIVGEADFSALYMGRKEDGWGTNADGGHDLYFMAGERRLFLTTGERCFAVDIDGLLRDLDQATGEVKRARGSSLMMVKSQASDDHFLNHPNYPKDKVGAKAINRVPGTSVAFVHAAPWYGPESKDFLSKTLLVSRGECDRPNLYKAKRGTVSLNNLKMTLQSDTYRCRVMTRLPTPKVDQELPVRGSAKLRFCGWTGSLGRVGFPYLRVTGMDQQIIDLFPTLKIPLTLDADNNLYGICVIEQDDLRRETIIRLHQCTGACDDGYDGVPVGDNPKHLVAVYAWATPFALDWTAKVTSEGLLVGGSMGQPILDQKLESVAAWVRTDQKGQMMQLKIINKDKGSFLETIPSTAQPFYSLILFAKSVEGFHYCSGEQLIAEDKRDDMEP
ncbi:hypothetical protein BGX28_001358 [Mortierella sp. GBA30]|nr:hypothetical protein BGX28_001358 [Mortierella sp. GBA30]